MGRREPPFECRVCGSADFRTLFHARDRLYGQPGCYSIVRCRACGLRATHPVPQDLTALYHADYAPHAPAAVRPLSSRLKKIFDLRTYWMPPLPTPSRVLEIGCGSGGFLPFLLGPGREVHAVEPVAAAAEQARKTGSTVFHGDLLDAGYKDRSFDAIFAWMVLEHLPRPRAALAKISRLLVPHGWFVFSVPNADAWEFGYFRGDGYALQVPTHVSHFSAGDLRNLLDPVGLSLRRVDHQRNVTSIIGGLGLRYGCASLVNYAQRPPRLAQAILYPLACVLAAFRQGGRLTCAARKRPS